MDWHALDADAYVRLGDGLRARSRFASRYFTADKMNIAALGNVTRQMHGHAIARHYDDPCWPQPVWGRLGSAQRYAAAEIDALRAALADALGLVPGGLA